MNLSKKLFVGLGILYSLQSLGIAQETVQMSSLASQEDISSAWTVQVIDPSPYPEVPYYKIVAFPIAERQLGSKAPEKKRTTADYKPLQKTPQVRTEIILTRPPTPKGLGAFLGSGTPMEIKQRNDDWVKYGGTETTPPSRLKDWIQEARWTFTTEGYAPHFILFADGTLVEHADPFSEDCQMVSNHNDKAIGIVCVVGEDQKLTEPMLRTLKTLKDHWDKHSAGKIRITSLGDISEVRGPDFIKGALSNTQEARENLALERVP